MLDGDGDRANRLPWPPIIYVVAAASAYALSRLGVPFPAMLIGYETAGWVLAALGIVIGLAGMVAFKSVGTAVDPTGRASVLVTGGIYEFTRNPMYLGAVLAFAGFALAIRSGGLLVLLPLIALALDRLAIRPEEAYLERRFGASYAAYRTRVRRWI